MKISELSAVLTRVQQVAGDVDVAFKDAETEVETVITDLGLHLDPSGAVEAGSLVIEHGKAPEAAPAGENAGASDAGSAEAAAA